MELVVDDAAVGRPLVNAVGELPPHIHASRLDALPLIFLQLGAKKLIERFLLAILPEPQRLAALQVADHGDEFHLLAEVHPHLFYERFSTRGAFQRYRYRRSIA